MRTRRPILYALAGISLLSVGIVSGCGSGGGGSTSAISADPQLAAQKVTEGRGALDAVVRSGGATDATKLTVVRDVFSEAYTRDKTNPQAAFGYAVIDATVHLQDVSTVAGDSGFDTTGLLSAAESAFSGNSNLLGGLLGGSRSVSLVRGVVAAPFALGRTADTVALRAKIQAAFDALNTDLPILETAVNQTGFSFVVADPRNGGQGTITLDQGDGLGVLAAFYAARATLGSALGYDFSTGGIDPTQTLEQRFGTLADGATLTPAQYLPPAPFGTLTSDGKARFAGAKADLLKAADVASSAATSIGSRDTQTSHLIDGTGFNLSTLRLGLAAFKEGLSNPFPLGNGVTSNLNALFSNPPADIRTLAPTYHVAIKDGARVLTATVSDFPDKTFGGLVTGLPDDRYTVTVPYTATFSDLLQALSNL